MSTISEALKMLKEDVDELSPEEAANEILKTTKYEESAKGNLAKLIAFWENESDTMPADAVENYKEADSELSKKYGDELVSWVDTYEKGEDDPGEGSWSITVHLKNGEVKKLVGDYEGFLGLSEVE